MKVTSRKLIRKSPLEVWNLLLNSNVDQAVYCPIFCLGVPRPVKCEYNIGELAASKNSRRCVSNRGEIRQEIDVFEPPSHLRFHLVKTDLAVRSCIERMHDEFHLQPVHGGTLVERVTVIDIKKPLAVFKEPFLWAGIKSVHRYVFDAWAA